MWFAGLGPCGGALPAAFLGNIHELSGNRGGANLGACGNQWHSFPRLLSLGRTLALVQFAAWIKGGENVGLGLLDGDATRGYQKDKAAANLAS